MKRIYFKYASIIGACYLFTLCTIYKCMPAAQSSTTGLSDLRYLSGNTTKLEAPQDLYKLNWRENDHVFFKKVREIAQQSEIADDDSDEDSIRCDSTSPPKFRKISAGIHIYSAYLDTRNHTIYIRMIAAVAKVLTKEYLNASLSCLFNSSLSAGNKSLTLLSRIQSYELCENHKKRFGGWILSCKVPRDVRTTPKKIIISFKERLNDTHPILKDVCVISRDKRIVRRKLKFGVCVPPLYGDVKAKSLIEFIEFNRILGAEVFILYIESSKEALSTEVRSVIRYYERQNVVNSFSWKLPFTQESIWYHGQSLAINDCLYKNMDDFEYLVFIDLDEFIIPQHDLDTWDDVIGQLNEMKPDTHKYAVGMSFKSTFYSNEFSRHVFSNEMSVSVRTNRTKHFSFRRNKVIVRPDKIFELGIHHVSKPLHESDNENVISVPTTVAHIHHYRACVPEFGIHCNAHIQDFSVPNKYGQRLIDNYLKILFDITP